MNIVKGKIEFKDKCWAEVSDECKNFILSCLEKDPNERIDAGSAVKHKWFEKKITEEKNTMHGFFKQLLAPKFKKLATNMIVNHMDRKEIEDLEKHFQQIDDKSTGVITNIEFMEALSLFVKD